MSLVVVQLSIEDCHLTIPPVWPLNPMFVPLPLQTTASAGVTVPPTDAGSTIAVATLETATHPPLWTTARNAVANVNGPVLKGLSVEAMSLVVAQVSVEDCHFTISPVCPFNPMVVPFPVQTAKTAGLAVPPTGAAFTVSDTRLELGAGEQVPLTTQT